MLAWLTVLPLVLLYSMVRRRYGLMRRESLLVASAHWGGWVVCLTESLSFGSALRTAWVALAWLLLSLLLLGLHWKARGRHRRASALGPWASFSRAEMWLLGAASLILVVLGVIALISAPNTWDSMTYHLSRVVHWLQNGSVAHYPTHIVRQLISNPLAEYLLLHLQLLSGGDRFANLVQWSSLIGVLMGTSCIARSLGAGVTGQALSAIFALTIPMALLQANSTQNDLLAGYWLVSFVGLTLSALESPRTPVVLAAAVSLGLALLTKATVYFFAFPFVVGLALLGAKRVGQRVVAPALLFVMIPLLLNGAFLQRNWALFGTPFGNSAMLPVTYGNDALSAKGLVSNILRNTALHLTTTSREWNASVGRLVLRLHTVLGMDINDPATTFLETHFGLSGATRHEDYAGNTVHLFVALLASVGVVVIPGPARRQRVSYLAMLAGAFLVFCLLLKWQPWNSRLHLPLFLMFSPLFGLACERVPRVGRVLAAALLLNALPWVLYNQCRPLLGPRSVLTSGREQQLFANFVNSAQMSRAYGGAQAFLKERQCGRIGLLAGNDGYEYPLWGLLDGSFAREVRIEHVLVSNASSTAGIERLEGWEPCAIVLLGAVTADRIRFHQREYRLEWGLGPVGVFTEGTSSP